MRVVYATERLLDGPKVVDGRKEFRQLPNLLIAIIMSPPLASSSRQVQQQGGEQVRKEVEYRCKCKLPKYMCGAAGRDGTRVSRSTFYLHRKEEKQAGDRARLEASTRATADTASRYVYIKLLNMLELILLYK